jgi:acetyltransferase-like isoleucine patch superfamily enzyme
MDRKAQQFSRGRLANLPGGRLISVVIQSMRRRLTVRGVVEIAPPVHLAGGSTIASQHGLSIGPGLRLGRFNTIEVSGRIGHSLLTSAHVAIVGRDDHNLNEVGTSVAESTWIGDRSITHRDQVVIGDDVWIGYGAVILSGTSIGSCAVVAAGAVVSSDVEPFAIVAGNPARVVGWRFSDAEARAAHLANLRSPQS